MLTLRATGGKQTSWNEDAWSQPEQVAQSWPSSHGVAVSSDNKADVTRYRALYEFVARNGDEISFQPGDIIMVIASFVI